MMATFDVLQGKGFQPVVLAPSEGPLAEALRGQNIEIVPFDPMGPDGTRRSLDILRIELKGAIASAAPDLVHANSLSMSRLSGPVVRELGVASIGHLRDIMRLNKTVIRDLNQHSRILAVSAATRNYHVGNGLDPEISFVRHNGVDLEQFKPQPPTGYLLTEASWPDDSQIVCCIGQIILRKGLDSWFRAARLIAETCPRARFLIVGERFSQKEESIEYENSLRDLANTEPLAGRCWFTGTRDDVYRLYNEVTVLLHSAREEPLGRVLLEGAATGRAIVATDVGGTREIFPDDAEAAIIVNPDSPEEMARETIRLLQDDAARNSLQFNARKRAEEAFDIRHAAAGLAEHYREVLVRWAWAH